MLVTELDYNLNELDLTFSNLVLQIFSFQKHAWLKDIIQLEELSEFFEKQNIQIIKKNTKQYITYGDLKRTSSFIIKNYENIDENSNFNETQKIEEFNDDGLKKLINTLKSEKSDFDKIKDIFERKIQNITYEKSIYSETITGNPTIIAKILLNTSKNCIVICLYMPKSCQTNKINVPIEEIKDIFFPYFSELVNLHVKEIGKRILNHYKKLFLSSPAFIKLLSIPSKNNLPNGP